MEEPNAQKLRARLDALKRGVLTPELAESPQVEGYEHDRSAAVEENTSGIVQMKPIVEQMEHFDIVTGCPDTQDVDDVNIEIENGVEVPPLPSKHEIINGEGLSDPNVQAHKADAQSFLDQVGGQDGDKNLQTDVSGLDSFENPEKEASIKKSKTRLILAVLVVLAGLAFFANSLLSNASTQDVVGSSPVSIDPPAAAPSLGSPVQPKISSATIQVQRRMSSVAPVLKRKENVVAGKGTIETATPAETAEEESTKKDVARKKPRTRGERVMGAVLPLKYNHMHRSKVGNTIALKAKADIDAPTKMSSEVVDDGSVLKRLETARSLH